MNKQLKYLFITRTLTGGGAERFVATFSSYLADNGCKVWVLSYEKSDNDYELCSNVNLIYMPERKENLLRKVSRFNETRKALKSIKPDIVIPFMNVVMFCSLLATIGLQTKLIYTVRVSPWHRGGTRLTNWMENIVAKYSDAIMLQTVEQGGYFKEYQDKLYVVPNPIPEKYNNIVKDNYSEKIRTIAMVGRLHSQKNFDLAIKCMGLITKTHPGICLKIYGSGLERNHLEQLIIDEGLEKVCILMGRRRSIEDALKESDMFLMTSDYEGMPNALMEAMAIGLPCLSSDCKTGPSDLIDDGNTGFLFKTGDIESLYNKLLKIIENPQQAQKVGKNARQHILRDFTLANTAMKFMEMVACIKGKK